MASRSFCLVKFSRCFAGILVLTALSYTQTLYASIVATGERRTATTSADGGFQLVNLVPDSNRLYFDQRGFKRYTVEATAPLIQTENTVLRQERAKAKQD